ncbi:MAG: hypothetical protein R2759_19545 [Bacteroidales bacterium]
MNADGKVDLVIGEESGNINYYENTGSASNPQFTLITDSLGKVNVTNPNLSYSGYTPCFFKDRNNKTELIVGSEEGKLFYFKNIDENLSGEFTENDSLYLLLNGEPLAISNGIRTGAAIAELDNDGFMNLSWVITVVDLIIMQDHRRRFRVMRKLNKVKLRWNCGRSCQKCASVAIYQLPLFKRITGNI